MDFEAIILAGGKGLGMNSDLPKSLVQIAGVPLIFHQLDYLVPKVDKIILSLGYGGDLVKKEIEKNYKNFDIKIEFILEEKPLGTAGAIKKSLAKIKSNKFLVLNSDDLTNINLEKLKQAEKNAICVARPRLPFGLVKEKDGQVIFIEKPKLNSWASCGWYLFEKEKLFPLLPDEGSLEYEVLPKLDLMIFKHKGYWYPINTPKDIIEFEKNRS